jgi:membrane dipeptidase
MACPYKMVEPMHLIVDAHQDLAWNALTFGRDYARPVMVTRELEKDAEAPKRNGSATIGLAELLLGHVGVIFGTLFASPKRLKTGAWDSLAYADASEAHRLYAQQLDYYERLADDHPVFQLVNTRGDLESILATWQKDDFTKRRIGLVRLMEGADGIREPKEAEWWMERGVRLIGPAWAGTRYSGGTGEPGPLTPEGRQLLKVMADLGLILDLAHMPDESYFEALDHFPGVVVCTHSNPRARVKNAQRPERFLSDEMIRRLAERGGVIGVIPFNRFLRGDWDHAEGKHAVKLEMLIAVIDHICQVTGSVAHVGLGSDFDGGFGVEGLPSELDHVGDLQKIGAALAERGYAEKDVAAILGGNWVEILRRGLPA